MLCIKDGISLYCFFNQAAELMINIITATASNKLFNLTMELEFLLVILVVFSISYINTFIITYCI